MTRNRQNETQNPVFDNRKVQIDIYFKENRLFKMFATQLTILKQYNAHTLGIFVTETDINM